MDGWTDYRAKDHTMTIPFCVRVHVDTGIDSPAHMDSGLTYGQRACWPTTSLLVYSQCESPCG